MQLRLWSLTQSDGDHKESLDGHPPRRGTGPHLARRAGHGPARQGPAARPQLRLLVHVRLRIDLHGHVGVRHRVHVPFHIDRRLWRLLLDLPGLGAVLRVCGREPGGDVEHEPDRGWAVPLGVGVRARGVAEAGELC